MNTFRKTFRINAKKIAAKNSRIKGDKLQNGYLEFKRA